MKLYQLRPLAGSRHKRKRLGRGTGSGHGKTSTRGHKGEKSRSGSSAKPGFEGGQMPLARRIPKRGFTNPFKKEFAIINVNDLNRFSKDSVVTPEALREENLIKKLTPGVKVLGGGELKKPLTVKAHAFSDSAVEKIKKAGGKAEKIK